MLEQRNCVCTCNSAQHHYPKLDVANLRTVGYSYAAFADNDEPSSQLIRVIFQVDSDENAACILFKIYKSHRATNYALAADTVAFAYLFDQKFLIKDTINMETFYL